MQIQLNDVSVEIIERSSRHIAGGVVSLNRKVIPNIVFERAQGSKLYDSSGKEYIDYHAAFAPMLLGHNFPVVNEAVIKSMTNQWSLMGSGTTYWESRLAELLCEIIPSLDLVQITNTGSEATAHAIRISRAYTDREDIILTLGGYNGWHDEVARSVMPTLDEVGPRISHGEYKFIQMSAGIPAATKSRVHIVNFNDLDSIEDMLKRFPVACLLTEPVLQNVGVIKPKAGYLAGLIKLCEKYGTVCIFDEVKTGFRTGLSGYQGECNVAPHLSVFGKALANGFPLGVVGGKKEIMQLFDSADPQKRTLIAGTYNAHPVNTAAAIATIEFLKDPFVYQHLQVLSDQLYAGLRKLFSEKGKAFSLVNNGSAFCVYFCEQPPNDLHDILINHDFGFDMKYRRGLIEKGIYQFPVACKQGSVSYSHSESDISRTLDVTQKLLDTI